MKVQAAVLRDREGPYQIEEVTLDDPRSDEVLVRVVATGMCQSDVLPRRFPELAEGAIITGHEGAGVVEQVGKDVSGVQIGDHVVLSYDSCGDCHPCTAGEPSYCVDFRQRNIGGFRMDGSAAAHDVSGEPVMSRWFAQSSFATYAVANQRNIVVIDRNVPLEIMGPLGCGIQTGAGAILHTLKMQAGESLVVIGIGGVGSSAVMAAKAVNAGKIIAVDLVKSRLDLALELGATHVIPGAADDIAGQVKNITGGGADYAFDATGVEQVIKDCIASIRVGGTCASSGIPTKPLVLDMFSLNGKCLRRVVEGGATPQIFIPRMIEMWRQGRFPFDRIIKTYPLSRINEAEADSLGGRVVKPVLIPGS